MKIRLFTAILAILPLFVTAPAVAQTKSDTPGQKPPQLKLRSDFWYHVAATPAYTLWQLNLHEGSHVIAGAMSGLTVEAYRPYPHFFQKSDGRHFTLGRAKFSGQTSRRGLGFIAAAPMVTEASLFISSDVMLGQINQDSPVAPFLWFGGMVYPLAHFMSSTLSPEETDLSMLAYSLDVNYDVGRAIIGAVSVVGIIRTVKRGHQVLFVEKADDPADAVAVMPIVGSGFTGLAVQGSF